MLEEVTAIISAIIYFNYCKTKNIIVCVKGNMSEITDLEVLFVVCTLGNTICRNVINGNTCTSFFYLYNMEAKNLALYFQSGDMDI